MKKVISFFAAMIMAVASVSPAFADGTTDDKDKDITVRIGVEKDGRAHHAPARIPMTVSYISFMSAIKITYLNDLGNVTVNVTNHSTGEYLEGTMNATTGVTMLPISGTDGFYTITFTVSDGKEYYGEFEL